LEKTDNFFGFIKIIFFLKRVKKNYPLGEGKGNVEGTGTGFLYCISLKVSLKNKENEVCFLFVCLLLFWGVVFSLFIFVFCFFVLFCFFGYKGQKHKRTGKEMEKKCPSWLNIDWVREQGCHK
jgi:predicted membrane protein